MKIQYSWPRNSSISQTELYLSSTNSQHKLFGDTRWQRQGENALKVVSSAFCKTTTCKFNILNKCLGATIKTCHTLFLVNFLGGCWADFATFMNSCFVFKMLTRENKRQNVTDQTIPYIHFHCDEKQNMWLHFSSSIKHFKQQSATCHHDPWQMIHGCSESNLQVGLLTTKSLWNGTDRFLIQIRLKILEQIG